jgi:hypothetical protein
MGWMTRLLGGATVLAGLSLPFAMATAASVDPPLVLELFTSEGCSSCPPADAYAAELARTRPDLLVLDFHVDYWNALGWHDPFSLAAATARQQRYAGLLRTELYTPQLVVGGTAQAIGSAREDVQSAIAQAEAARRALPPVSLTLSTQNGQIRIAAGSGTGAAQLWLVGYDTAHRTPIGRGENAGLSETEADIVRSIQPVATWSGAPLSLAVARPPGERTAILLQRADGTILAAAVLPSAAS